jgi:hypothetical protein
VSISRTIDSGSPMCVGYINSVITFLEASGFPYSQQHMSNMFTFLIPCKAGMLCIIISTANDCPQTSQMRDGYSYLSNKIIIHHFISTWGIPIEISTEDVRWLTDTKISYLKFTVRYSNNVEICIPATVCPLHGNDLLSANTVQAWLSGC